MPGKIAIIKPTRLTKFVAKPAPGGAFDLPDANNDPVIEGATVVFFDTYPGSLQPPAVFVLAPGPTKWKALGNPPGSKGYVFKGDSLDPCRVVSIKPKIVKAICGASGLSLPLGEDLGVILTAGTDSKRYCAQFGGTPKGDPTVLFKRKGAPGTSGVSGDAVDPDCDSDPDFYADQNCYPDPYCDLDSYPNPNPDADQDSNPDPDADQHTAHVRGCASRRVVGCTIRARAT